MMFYCDSEKKYNVISELKKIGGEVRSFNFTNE